MLGSALRVASVTVAIAWTVTAAVAQDETSSLVDIVEAWLSSPHGDLSSEAFTHWNEDGEVPGQCAVCHSSPGAMSFFSGPMTTPGIIDHSVAPGTSVDCAVCHSRAGTDLVIGSVSFGCDDRGAEVFSSLFRLPPRPCLQRHRA